MRRFACSVVLLVTAMPVLSACSVPENGIAGVTADADGNLMATLAWCSDSPPDVVILSEDGETDEAAIVNYHAPRLTGRTTSFRLDRPAAGWTAKPGPPDLDPSVEYRLYGTTNDSSTSLRYVTFRVDDRLRLSPGRVLVDRTVSDQSTGFDVDSLVSRSEFEELAQEYC